jgi:hypothetical protein
MRFSIFIVLAAHQGLPASYQPMRHNRDVLW